MRETKSIQGFDGWWKFFCLRFADLHERDAGYLGVTRYLSAVLGEISVARSSDCPNLPLPPREDFVRDPEHKNVLFIPNIATNYCLGSCLKVASRLLACSNSHRVFFLKSFEEEPPGLAGFPLLEWENHLKKSFLGVRFLMSARQFEQVYLERLTEIPECCQAFEIRWGRFWKLKIRLWVLRLGMEIEVARRWMASNEIGLVLTINDLVKPSNPFIAAAKSDGISTVLIQHGTLGPHNAPYAASEYWSWGGSSTEMLTRMGANPESIVNLGNLEMEGQADRVGIIEVGGPPRLLVLLQWTGTAAWGDKVFKEIVLFTGRAREKIAPDWILHIRTHPKDSPEVVKDCRDTVAAYLDPLNINYEYSAEGATVESDVQNSTAVITVNSSAMAHAICLRKPHLQFLPDQLERRIGSAFVSRNCIAQDQHGLDKWLAEVVSGKPLRAQTVDDAIANFGQAIEIAVDRILMRLSS